MIMIAYPLKPIPSKKLLKEAIQLAGLDMEFVIGQTFFGGLKTRKLSDLEPGEVLTFCGPRPEVPKYFGRLAKTPVRGVDLYEIE